MAPGACLYRYTCPPICCTYTIREDDIAKRPHPTPTFPRKLADVDWGSRKINPNKICAECWPGAAFGPCWLLTERLRYETTPSLPPALRARVRVHGQRDDAHGGHCGSRAASGGSRAAGADRKQHKLTHHLSTWPVSPLQAFLYGDGFSYFVHYLAGFLNKRRPSQRPNAEVCGKF